MAPTSKARAWARGGSVFAGAMMLITGIFQLLIGVAAIADDGFFVGPGGYIYQWDTTAWGWVHLLIGALVVIAGLLVFSGRTWARTVGIVMAIVTAVNNFLFLPWYPLWSVILIALSILAIWALVVDTGPVGAHAVGSTAAAGTQRDSARWEAMNRSDSDTADTVPTEQPTSQQPAVEPVDTGQSDQPPTATPRRAP